MNTDNDKKNPADIDLDIVERLRDVMADRRINQKKLAEMAGVTDQTVYRWMRKGVSPSKEALLKIAEGANVSRLWLIDGVGPRSPNAVWAYHARKKDYSLNDVSMLYQRISEIMAALNINKERLTAIAKLSEVNFESDFWLTEENLDRPSPYIIERIANATGYNKDWIWYGRGNRLDENSNKSIDNTPHQKETNDYVSPKQLHGDLVSQSTAEPHPSSQKYEHLIWKFQHIFDFLLEAHEDDTIAINDFLNKLENNFLMKDPDYRLWKYQKREEAAERQKKRAAEGYPDRSVDITSANGKE